MSQVTVTCGGKREMQIRIGAKSEEKTQLLYAVRPYSFPYHVKEKNKRIINSWAIPEERG